MPLRTVAAYLDIDQAILSKMERGLRKAKLEQIVKLAVYFNVKEDDLLIAWLSDNLVIEKYVMNETESSFDANLIVQDAVLFQFTVILI